MKRKTNSTYCPTSRQVINKIEGQGLFRDPKLLLAEKETELQQKQSLLHFFWEYNRYVTVSDTRRKFEALSEAVRNSFLPPNGFRVTGAAFWQKQGHEGITHVGGNVGRGKFFPFQRKEDNTIYVVDVFLSGKWAYYQRRDVAPVYVLCYPIGTEHVLSVHFSGIGQLADGDLREIVDHNNELLRTIDHLIGGDSV